MDEIRFHGSGGEHGCFSNFAPCPFSAGGRPVILTVEAGRMHRDGLKFCRSENGVWLADRVPSQYLKFPETEGVT